jgi:predicted O-linked N-acetylglucosamine transferase (SPINDLY family)
VAAKGAARARASFEQALALHQQGRLDEARLLYQKALQGQPQHLHALINLGVICLQTQQPQRAVELLGRALRADPRNSLAHNNLGNALRALAQPEAAIASYERAIALAPDHADAYFNRGAILAELTQYEAAIASYGQAIARQPGHVSAYNNRGLALINLKRYQDAIADFDRALALSPKIKDLYGARLFARMQLCDWDGIEADLAGLRIRIERHERASVPFSVLALLGSAALQRTATERWTQDCYPINSALPAIAKHSPHPRIRIGYFSADFREHATLHLMAGLFEEHDRSRFELSVFSFGSPSQDPIRKRLEAACEHFLDVRQHSDQQIALLARERQIDIAIDLKGFTQEHRAGVFALRAAPLQVSYLGYPGTMGAPYMDYLIADHTLIPAGSELHYAEKIIFLPNSYQINDARRSIAEHTFTRAQLGLPPAGLVFCCFNNSYKIAPSTFDSWMRILKRTEPSVLWLLEDNPAATANLRREALRRGVDAQRLVFAPRVPLSEHLARHRFADLFLDTLPYNAHTSASDALWAGVPVLTCVGEAFASRVAASLLHAMDLPELITLTPEDYEKLAVALGNDPQHLADIRQKLSEQRLTAALFNTRLSTRHLETAYSRIYERYQADLPAEHITH